MNNTNDILQNVRSVARLYRSYTHAIAKSFSITDAEIEVLAFLHTNPQYSTAKEITEVSLMTKSNVSQAVDRLIYRDMLMRERDGEDRRRIHLYLTDKATPILNAISYSQREFTRQIVMGFSAQEIEAYVDFNSRIAQNALMALNNE